MHKFQIDPRLSNDSSLVTELELCQVRLHHNAAFPWLMLIPKRSGTIEIIDLDAGDQQLLMQEIAHVSCIMRTIFAPRKLNVANLGNIVEQLHVHVIARFSNDEAWPGPIWNSGVSSTYREADLAIRIKLIRNELACGC